MHHNHNNKLLKDKMPLMISCDEATYIISKNQHEKIGIKKWIQLKIHLMMCVYCRRYEKQIRLITKIINKIKSFPETNSSEYKLTSTQKKSLKEIVENESNKE